MSKHYEKYNRIQEKLIEMADENCEVVATYHEIAEVCGIHNLSSTRNYLLRLVAKGFLEVLVEPQRGVKGTTYKINCDKKREATESDESDFITINFGGVELHIIKETPVGMAMDIEDLAVSCLTEKSTIEKIFDANRELFEPTTFISENKVFVNRTGILAFLLKLNTSRILEVKRQTLIDFNNTVLSIMQESMLRGRVILKDHQQIEIRTNISNITGLEIEQVELMFHKIEEEVNGIIGELTGEIKFAKQETHQVEKKLNRTSSLLESEKHKKEMCMSQVQELKGKLLERQQ